jgi:DNA-binding beta-propeller fold protein YncE
VLSGASDAVVATIPVGASPKAITINESTDTLYTFNSDGSVSALDAAQNALVANFPVDSASAGLLGLDPRAIAYSRRTGKLYAINGFNQIDVVDPLTRRVLKTLPDLNASNVAINQSANRIYVSQYFDGTVWVIDGANDEVVGVIADVGLPATPAGCYQTSGGVASCVQAASGLTGIAVDESLNRIYVLGQYDGRLVTIDGRSNAIVARQFVNPDPYGLAVNPKTHTVFADNVAAPGLWVYDGQANRVADRVSFNTLLCNTQLSSCYGQTDLKSVAVNPATGNVYVLDYGDLNPQKTSLLFILSPAGAPPNADKIRFPD